MHGAIDARVRALAGDPGDLLHSGRSRNDQVATTLALYVRDRAAKGFVLTNGIACEAVDRARLALADGTVLAATTHWQPAQPMLLAFWLGAVAEMFARCAFLFEIVQAHASLACPLGSAAGTGSSLALDRDAAARALGFAAPSRNALDAIGNRDAALNLLLRRDAIAHRCFSPERGTDRLVHARVRFRETGRRGIDRVESHAAKTQSRSVRTRACSGTRRDRGPHRRARLDGRPRPVISSRSPGDQAHRDRRNGARARGARGVPARARRDDL